MQIKKPFYKINFEDIDIASEFFDHNQKHLSEFIMATITYYSGKNVEIKSKLVEKYFKTYKKTMDFVMLSKCYGKKGALIKAENQIDSSQTLKGLVEAPLAETLPTNNKEINIKNKELINKDKEEIELWFEQFSKKENWFNLWNSWTEYKSSQFKFSYKSKKTEMAAIKELFTLSGRNFENAKKIVNKSIANGYKGLFPINESNKPAEKNETQIKSMLQQRKEDAAKLLNNNNE